MYLNDARFDEFLDFGGYLRVLKMAKQNKNKKRLKIVPMKCQIDLHSNLLLNGLWIALHLL